MTFFFYFLVATEVFPFILKYEFRQTSQKPPKTNQKPTKPPKNQSNDPKSYSNQTKTPKDFENHLKVNLKKQKYFILICSQRRYFHIKQSGGGGGSAPKFASEICVIAPNFTSKVIGDKHPKFCPLNFRPHLHYLVNCKNV